jgi:hypothetical protein
VPDMMSMINYRIPKIEVKIEVLINQESTVPGEYILFLNEFSRYRKGEETIFEFLNKEKEKCFIPLKNAVTGEFIIVCTDELIYVKEQEETQIPPSIKRLRLQMTNNIQLEVDHFKLLPESQSRVLDYLNDKSQLIVFYQENRKIYINKTKIRTVTEL